MYFPQQEKATEEALLCCLGIQHSMKKLKEEDGVRLQNQVKFILSLTNDRIYS